MISANEKITEIVASGEAFSEGSAENKDIDNEGKLGKLIEGTLSDIYVRASATKEGGILRLKGAIDSCGLPEGDISRLRQESEVDIKLGENSEMISELVRHSVEQISVPVDSGESKQGAVAAEEGIKAGSADADDTRGARVLEAASRFSAGSQKEVANGEQFQGTQDQGIVIRMEDYKKKDPDNKEKPSEELVKEVEKVEEGSSERYREKITNPEANAILDENSERFRRNTELFKKTIEETAQNRQKEVEEFKKKLSDKLHEICSAQEEIQYLYKESEKIPEEISALGASIDKYKADIGELSKNIFSRLLNRNGINSIEKAMSGAEEKIQELKEKNKANVYRRQELSQAVESGNLSPQNLTAEERKALISLENSIGKTVLGINPATEKATLESVEASAKDHFFGAYGKYGEENNKLLRQLNILKNELTFGESTNSIDAARDIEEVERRAISQADDAFKRALDKYDELTYIEIAKERKKSVEEIKKEIYEKERVVWREAYSHVYSAMSGYSRASLELIGLKEADMDTYIQIEDEAKKLLGLQFENTAKKDFEYARYRAYYEARRTGQNIFTHVTSGERAEKIIKERSLKSSKIHTPSELRGDMNALKKSGQTGNIEESLYFTSGGGGFNYGTKLDKYEGQEIERDLKDFAFFAATGNDLLASGKSIEVATPTMREKGESLKGQAVGDYESADGTELSLESLQLIIPESEISRYISLFENAGYNGNFAKEHLVGVPNDIVEKALNEGNGLFLRDSKVLHEYVDNQLKREVKNRSKNKDKIFATVKARKSEDGVTGRATNTVFQWQQIN